MFYKTSIKKCNHFIKEFFSMTAIPTASKNQNCPICLEDNNTTSFLLSCFHSAHITCIEKMNSLECALCRRPMYNLPKKIRDSILKNQKDYKEEQVRQEHNELLRAMNAQQELEVRGALNFLMNSLPSRYVPELVELERDEDSPCPPSGIMFSLIIEGALTRALEDMTESYGEGYENIFDEEIDSEDEDNPFNDIPHTPKIVMIINHRD